MECERYGGQLARQRGDEVPLETNRGTRASLERLRALLLEEVARKGRPDRRESERQNQSQDDCTDRVRVVIPVDRTVTVVRDWAQTASDSE